MPDSFVQVSPDSTGKQIDNVQTLVATAVGLACWKASTVYAAGAIVQPVNPGTATQFICTVGGTTSATEPTWPTTAQGTVVDGSVTWREYSSRQRQRITIGDSVNQAASLLVTAIQPPPQSTGAVVWLAAEQFDLLKQLFEDMLSEMKLNNYIVQQGLNVSDTEVDQARADIAQDYMAQNQNK